MGDNKRDIVEETFSAAKLVQELVLEIEKISSSKGIDTEDELANLFKKYFHMFEEQSAKMPDGEMQNALSAITLLFREFEQGPPTVCGESGAYQAARSFINTPHIRMLLTVSADFEAISLISRMMQHINFDNLSVQNDFPEDIRKDFIRLVRESADMRKQADAWCVVFLTRGQEVPKMLKDYLVAKTAGALPELSKGANKRALILRNHVISMLIDLLHEGFSIPRENHTGGMSACGVIAECLGEIGINMGESAVRKCATKVSGTTIFDLAEQAQPGSAELLEACRKSFKNTFP